jgi:hypothetical protein
MVIEDLLGILCNQHHRLAVSILEALGESILYRHSLRTDVRRASDLVRIMHSSPASTLRASPRATWPSPMEDRPQPPDGQRSSAPPPVSRDTAEGQIQQASPSRKLEQVKTTILEDPNVLKVSRSPERSDDD